MKPMVSVIIPAFNCEKTILQTLTSVLNQTMTSFEIVVIDDCSTDQTHEIVKGLALTENRILLRKNPRNLGVAETRNIGCSYAVGQYIAFVDSDDSWEGDKLEKQLREMQRTGSCISYTSYYIISENKKKLYQVPTTIAYRDLLKENVIGCSTVMIQAELMKKHRFDSDFFHEDYVLWLTLLRKGYRAVGLDEALVYYQKGGRSSNKLIAAKNRWHIYRQAEGLPFMKSCFYMLYYTYKGIRKHAR